MPRVTFVDNLRRAEMVPGGEGIVPDNQFSDVAEPIGDLMSLTADAV